MKKLIEELQTEIERRELKDIALEGLFLALQIVKSYDPWIDVCELPPDGNRVNLSIEVIVKNKRNEMTVGHYNYNHSKWECDFEPFIPIKWTYLPEVKP